MKINRVLAIFTAIGIIFSAILAYQRFDRELDYKTYEVNMYYSELEKLASQEGKSMEQILQEMSNTGIQNMLIKEDTVQSLKQNPNYHLSTKMEGYDMIVESDDEELIKRIYSGFNDVKKENRKVTLEDKNTVRIQGSALDYIEGQVLTVGSYGQKIVTAPVWSGSMLEVVGIGYDEKAIELSKKAGYGVILSPTFYSDFQDAGKSIDRYINTIETTDIDPSHIIFSGNQVLGYDFFEFEKIQKQEPVDGKKKFVTPEFEKLANFLEDRNIAVALIESSSQGGYLKVDGINDLVKLMDFDAVGSYLTWDFVTNKYDYEIPFHHNGEEIANVMFRGITTRNIRVISMKPFVMQNRYIADPQAYKNVLDNLETRLSAVNMKPAEIKTIEFFDTSRFLKIPIMIGIIAAWLMVLDNLVNIKKKNLYILLSLGAIGSIGVLGLGIMLSLVEKIGALLGAMVMPSLAGCHLLSLQKNIDKKMIYMSKPKAFIKAEGVLLSVIAICMGSVLFEVAMLTHSRYLLGIETFAGVKFSQMIPMLIIMLMYIAYFGYKRNELDNSVGISKDDIMRLATDKIMIWQIAVVGIFGIILMIFMSRSGNSAAEPSMVEVLLRNFLEFIFPARPRTKAIFVGFPFTIMMMYFAYTNRFHKFRFAFIVLASIGLVNTVNTFSHTKAALVVSVYRTGAEFIVGSLVAIAAILVIEYIQAIVNKHINKRKGSVLNGL